MISDIIVDTLFEENLIGAIQVLGAGRLVMDPENPEEPYLHGEEGYLVVRVKTDGDPIAFARELERRTANMRIVTVIERTASKE